MDHHKNPPFDATGKVLALVPRRRGRPTTTLDVAMVNEERAQLRKQQRAAAWFDGLWVLLAWSVSVWELRLAIPARKVFDVETTIAFLVAIALPLARARRIFTAARKGVVVLKRARAMRRAKRERNTRVETPRDPAHRPLQ